MGTLRVFGTLVGGSWVFSSVSTCSTDQGRSAGEQVGIRTGEGLTQSLLEGLDIAALGAALSPLLIVGAGVSQTRTSAAAGTDAVALELALPAYHACQSLWLGDARVVGGGLSVRRGVVLVSVGAPGTLLAGASAGAVVGRIRHDDG